MRPTFNPLPFVFVPFGDVPETPACFAYETVKVYRLHMLRAAFDISPEAYALLRSRWSEYLNAALLDRTREWCTALRAGFKGYQGLN